MAQNQAKAKKHPKTELLLIEKYYLSSSTLSSNGILLKIMMAIFLENVKKKQVRLFWWGYMNNDNENEAENEI